MCAQEYRERHPQAASCSITRGIEVGFGVCIRDDLGKIVHSRFQAFEVGVSCAFLPSEHPCRAVRPKKRVAHVAHDRELRALNSRVQVACVYTRDSRKVCSAAGQLVARCVEESHAERPKTAHAPIVCTRTAQANGYFVAILVEREANRFAHAITRGGKGVALSIVKQCQPTGRCCFHEYRSIADEDLARKRAHETVMCGEGDALSLRAPCSGRQAYPRRRRQPRKRRIPPPEMLRAPPLSAARKFWRSKESP